MKKLLTILLLVVALIAPKIVSAQGYYVAIVYTGLQTNVWGGTNVVTYGDPLPIMAQKINGNFSFVLTNLNAVNYTTATLSAGLAFLDATLAHLTNGDMYFDGGAISSSGSGQINANSLKAGLLDNVSSSGLAGQVPNANGDGTWTWSVGTPTNVLLSSQQLVYFNNPFFNFGTSNFVATVPNLFSWTLVPPYLGGGGLTPGTNAFEQLCGSFDGTTWFVITNGFTTTNTIQISVSGAGGGYGEVVLNGTDHPELVGRTNSLYGQHVFFPTPVNGSDAATKNYVDVALAAANLGSQFIAANGTNGMSHYSYSAYGKNLFDLTSSFNYIPVGGTAIDGTGTNITLSCIATNLVGNWQLRETTNLLIPFIAWTNYTTNIASGVCTFTIPITQPAQFFCLVRGTTYGVNANVTLSANAGIFYPSNTWSVAAITNGMGNFSYWTGNSNGQALVSLYLSNGVVWIKQLAP